MKGAAQAALAPAGKVGRILIVDDNVDGLRMMQILLEAAGHVVRIAGDGHSALAVAKEFRPDVILLDIGMPGVSGYEVARQLRELAAFADVRLIAVTGYGRAEDVQQSFDAGFDDHLTKPVNPDVLRSVIAGTRAGTLRTS